MQQDLDQTSVLIRDAQAGNREAFAQLVESHYDLMYRYALKFTGDTADAEDVTQQACIRLARGIGQFRFQSQFSTWLYTLVINCGRDYFKSQKATEVLDDESAADGATESGIELRQVLKRIEAMGEGFRETVALVVGEDLSHAAAAEILGVKESTVSWRIHEVRKRLLAGNG